jgi:hypothetical protein
VPVPVAIPFSFRLPVPAAERVKVKVCDEEAGRSWLAGKGPASTLTVPEPVGLMLRAGTTLLVSTLVVSTFTTTVNHWPELTTGGGWVA